MSKNALEEARRESLKKEYQKTNGKTEPEGGNEPNGNEPEGGNEPNNSEKETQVQGKSSGDGQDSPYLENNNDSEDEPNEVGSTDSEKKSLLENVFQGDTSKMEKSYLESQREYNRLNQKHKEILSDYDKTKNLNDNVENVLNQNPALRSLFEKATQGQDVESLINQMSKPSQGKSTGSIDPSDQGKLETDEFLPTTERLIELGYIKQNLDNLTDFDRERAVLNAQSKYMREKTPELIQNQVNNALSNARQEEQKKSEIQKLTDENTTRFEDGFDQAVINYGLNFTGEHKDLFDEIYTEAKAMRDPSEQRLIRENAVDIATREVLNRHNIQPNQNNQSSNDTDKSDGKKDQKKRIFSTSGNSGSGEKPKNSEPTTVEEKMRQRRLERSDSEMKSRRNYYRQD